MNTKNLSAVLAVFLIMMLACIAYSDDVKTFDVSGIVKYSDGKPAAGAHLKSRTQDTKTDENGVYHLKLFPACFYFNVTKGDLVACGGFCVKDDGTVEGDTNFTLSPSCLVMGEVTDTATGMPISDADVSVEGSGYGSASTDKDGVFKVSISQTDGLTLKISKDGYNTKRTNFSSKNLDTLAFRIQLSEGGIIKGTITDEEGKPIEKVQVTTIDDQVYANSAYTDADGRYILKNVNIQRPVDVRVSTDEYHDVITTTVSFIKDSKELEMNFRVKCPKNRNLEGTVFNDSGNPVEGAEVDYGSSSYAANAKTAITDASGKWTIKDVSPEKDIVIVKCKGYAPGFARIEEGNDRVISIHLIKGRSVNLHVVNNDGKPIPNVSVSISTHTSALDESPVVIGSGIYNDIYNIKTDENGYVELTDLPEKGTCINLWAKDYDFQRNTEFATDQPNITIKMPGKQQLGGRVIDAKTGNPVTSFIVKWFETYRDNSVINNSDGKFMVRPEDSRFMDKQFFDVKVFAKGYYGETKQIKVTNFPVEDYSSLFKLEKSAPIVGKITDTKGFPIEGATVSIVEQGGFMKYGMPEKISDMAYKLSAISSKDGTFKIDAAKEKVADILVQMENYAIYRQDKVDLSKPLNIKLSAPAFIEMNIKSLIKDSTVSIHRITDKSETQVFFDRLNPDGYFKSQALEPALYRITLASDKKSVSRLINLKSSETKVVDLLSPMPVILRGVVTRVGKPVANATVRLQDQSSMTTGEDGKYEIYSSKTGDQSVNYSVRSADSQITDNYCELFTLENGINVFNIKLNTGVISGRVELNEFAANKYMVSVADKRKSMQRMYIDTGIKQGWRWNSASTFLKEDGSFVLNGVGSGEFILSVHSRDWQHYYTSQPLILKKDRLDDIDIKIKPQGMVSLKILDEQTGTPIKNGMPSRLYTSFGVVVCSLSSLNPPAKVPVGEYNLWVKPIDGIHSPAKVKVTIKPDKIANITVKLPKAKQRLIFKIAEGSKYSKLKTYNDDMSFYDIKSSVAWIGYEIKDAVTGKPAIQGPDGPEWGDYLTKSNKDDIFAIALAPGRYKLDAVLRTSRDYNVKSNDDLWHINTVVKVTAGKDTVIVIK